MNILRNIKIGFVLAAVSLASTACLDKYPEAAIPENEAMSTYDDAEQLLSGIYALMNNASLFSGGLTLLPDIQADLVYAVEGNSNVYGDIWQWKFRATNSDIEGVYAALYNVIANCNFFLDGIDAVVEKQTDDQRVTILDYYTGEVYGIRALCYSELLKCFCKAYDPATAKQELGVVLRTSYKNPESSHRASLYDSYAFVISDLMETEKRLDEENDSYSSIYMTRAAAQALHARMALYMQDWDTAIEYAGKLISRTDTFKLTNANTAYNTSLSLFDYLWQYDAGFEVIMRQGFTITSYGGSLGTVFLNLDRDRVYYYPDYVPAQWALDLYETNDLRYNAYFTETTTGYANGLTWPLLTKYLGNQNFLSNMIYHVSMPKMLRLSEQYLIRAEAYCRKGNYTAAASDLTTLHQNRYASGGSVNLGSDNWLDYISNERVRELYMEGFRLNDLKRWKRGFTRKAQSYSQSAGSTLSVDASNPLFVWPIPQHEIDAPGSEVEPNDSNL